jgi:hypothetical protein
MATTIKLYDSTSQTFLPVSATKVVRATFEDRGSSSLNKLLVDFVADVATGTANPFFNREIKLEVDGVEVFGGTVEKRVSATPLFKTTSWSYGAQFLNRYVNEVYLNKSPEFIVQNVIETYTDLTYTSAVVTGLTIERIVFRDKTVAEVIETISQAIGYYFYSDKDKNAYFEAIASQASGEIITVATDSLALPEWEYNANNVVTKVIVEGEKQSFFTTETFAASGDTSLTLAHQPVGSITVVDDGTELLPTVDSSAVGTYSVDAENKLINFDSPVSGTVVINYTRAIPIKVTLLAEVFDDDGNQIIRERKIINKSIKTYADARTYGRGFLDKYSSPQKTAEILLKQFVPALQANQTVRVIDANEGIDEIFLIADVEYNYETGITTVTVGATPDLLFDWQKEVMVRLRELAQENTSEDLIQEYRLFQHEVVTSLTQTVTTKVASPVDSFIAGHDTLGRARADKNFEADCSTNTNHGTWGGTGISGSQYLSTTTFESPANFLYPLQRLATGTFNGSDNVINTAAVSEAGVVSVSFFMNPDTNSRDIMELAAGIKISLDSSGNITTTGLTSVSTTATATTNGTHVYVTFDSITLTNPKLGYSSSYYSGALDEFCAFTSTLSAQYLSDIRSQEFDSSHSAYTNCVLWWSFDNPTAGDRHTANTTVEIL